VDIDRSRAVLIVNTKSRRGQEWFEQAQTELAAGGVKLEKALSFRKIDELIAEAKSCVARKVPLVIGGGGDGTFSAIANIFARSQTLLGVLPLGTGNAFARDLGIKADLQEACKVIAEGKQSWVDMGMVGNRDFLNVATLGVTTRIARELTVENKRRFGRFVYAVAIVDAIRSAKPFHVVIETENGTTEFDTLQVVIGNGRFHAGPFPIAPDASITAGQLSLYGLKSKSKLEFLRYALHLPFGQHVKMENVHSEHTKSGVLKSSPTRSITIDGEICESTPITFGVQPRALGVITPQDFTVDPLQ
jgi:YegS/Rv2252/BmrU family lipid kinase